MSKKSKRILWGVVLLVVVIGAISAVQQKKKNEKKATQVSVEQAENRNLVATVSAEGKIEPVTQVKVSAEIPGRIVKLAVKEGDIVKEGDFLVELDPETYVSALDAAKSALKSAQASKLKADADYKRTSELVERGMSSQADLDAMQASAKLAEADLERADGNRATICARPDFPLQCRARYRS